MKKNEGKLKLVRTIRRHLRKLNESISYYDEMLEEISRAVEENKIIDCPYCSGRGFKIDSTFFVREEICEICEGSGKI